MTLINEDSMTTRYQETEEKIKALTFQTWLSQQPIETTMNLYAKLYDQLKDVLGEELEPIESDFRGAMAQALQDHHDWAAAQDPKTMMEICNGCAKETCGSGYCGTDHCDGVEIHGKRLIKR